VTHLLAAVPEELQQVATQALEEAAVLLSPMVASQEVQVQTVAVEAVPLVPMAATEETVALRLMQVL
jgi:hypothetical protein